MYLAITDEDDPDADMAIIPFYFNYEVLLKKRRGYQMYRGWTTEVKGEYQSFEFGLGAC